MIGNVSERPPWNFCSLFDRFWGVVLRLPTSPSARLSIIIRIEMHRQFKRFIDRRQCRQI